MCTHLACTKERQVASVCCWDTASALLRQAPVKEEMHSHS